MPKVLLSFIVSQILVCAYIQAHAAKPSHASSGQIRAKPVRVTVPQQKRPDELLSIAQDIAKTEEDAAALDASIGNHRRELLEASKSDHYATFVLAMSEQSIVANLDVKIDGFTVYNVAPTKTIFAPAESTTIYDGPINPGHHKVDINLKTIKTSGNADDLNPTFQISDKSFELDFPNEAFKKIITINLSKSGEATLSQQDIVREVAP